MDGLISKFSRMLKSIYYEIRKFQFSRIPGIKIGSGVVFDGKPIINVLNGGSIVIGDNVTLNSSNRGYHLNMYTPVKLFADRPGAKIEVGQRTRIHGSCLHAYTSIVIGEKCLIAANCQIIDSSGHNLSFDNIGNRINTLGNGRPIVVQDCVWIGANTIILPGVTIGKGSVIGAGSIITKDIPPMVVAAGNPARVIKAVE